MPSAKPTISGQRHNIAPLSLQEQPNTVQRKRTELEKREILRMSNEESNRLTRECLQTALIHLMSEKPFEQITITELVKRSGVSRTAFYRNYTSKDMILTELSNAFFDSLTQSLDGVRSPEDFYRWYRDAFQIIYDRADLFRLLMLSHLPKHALVGAEVILERVHPSSTPEEHYRLVALENGFAAILADWFNSGMKESAETMAALCVKTLPMW